MADRDNKFGKAKNLGLLGSSPLSKSDRLSLTDLDDLYRFKLAERSSIDLSLSKIAKGAKVDVELYALKGSLGRAIGKTDFRKLRPKDLKSSLQLVSALGRGNLQSGEYFIRVLQRKGSSSYQFKLAATPIIDPPLDTKAPTASANAANLSISGGSKYSFTVTYSDDVALNVGSLDSSDIRVTGSNSFSQLATRVSVSDSNNGTPRTATYEITAPGGTWDSTDNGSYSIALQANQVSDTIGNFAGAATLKDFLVNIAQNPPADTTAPTASLSAASPVKSASTYDFTVTYSDDVAVDVSSFDNSDIQVTGPNGFSQSATKVSVSSSGTLQTVTYQLAAPGGSWDSADSGNYSVTLQASQVSDTSKNFATTATLGDFLVDFPRRILQFSGGSNGPYDVKFNLDTSIQDIDNDPTKGFFPNAIQSLEVSNYSRPPLIFNFGSASIQSFEAEVPVIEVSDFPSVRRTLYQATFPTVNIKQTPNDRDFLVNTLTFLVGPLSQDDNFVNSLSSLENFTGDYILVPAIYDDGTTAGTRLTSAYEVVLTNEPTISRSSTTNPNGNYFSGARPRP